ncbi:para-aminobenzoate synthase [Sporosarcina sp. HYO08]|nr:anthranilate synthase component I family protein [Sporosarcina sp. HYO08]KXH86851.1 para-aminobenzoate synthase [Sporosarcina sp. HYO08]
MQGKQPVYTAMNMTKEQFFYGYKQLAVGSEQHVLLESGRGGNLCIAGIDPLVTLENVKENVLRFTWRDGKEEVQEGDPLELLTNFAQSFGIATNPALPDFQGGLVGFISYDYMRQYEQLNSLAKDDLHTPDLFFYVFDRWAVHDIENEQTYFMTLPERELDPNAFASEWMAAAAEGLQNRRFSPGDAVDVLVDAEDLQVSVTKEQFVQMVQDVQNYIENEEVQQVNLTIRQSKKLHADPLDMYEALRSFNPSPYMASIGAKEFTVVSGSPELLLKKRGSELSTRPIGGTRPRGKNEVEDAAFASDLLSDEKETAEHKMLVDIEVEDFKRVCMSETVETDEFMVIEKYSHVMHLVSNVRGTAAPGFSNAAILKGVFPGGSITGAPKLRTMEIIEELEPTRRGLYTGSIGWLGFNGDMEWNIVIRTAFINQGIAHIQAGAGLVADSIPEAEYIESLNKGKALWQAKAMAESRK